MKMKTWNAAILSALLLATGSSYAATVPDVVSQLDLTKYAGKWYQIASTNPIFQAGCVCVTATYKLNDDGTIGVTNSCRLGVRDGLPIDGEAVGYKSDDPAKLSVAFGGFKPPFTNYWVVDLAKDYSYAVVSTAVYTPIWILSRTPTLADETLNGINERLQAKGFPVWSVTPTLQAGCNN